MKNGHDPKRGRHKKHVSKETARWNEEHLIPERPPWMPEETYVKLAALRKSV
jgi:hypothetical protein